MFFMFLSPLFLKLIQRSFTKQSLKEKLFIHSHNNIYDAFRKEMRWIFFSEINFYYEFLQPVNEMITKMWDFKIPNSVNDTHESDDGKDIFDIEPGDKVLHIICNSYSSSFCCWGFYFRRQVHLVPGSDVNPINFIYDKSWK